MDLSGMHPAMWWTILMANGGLCVACPRPAVQPYHPFPGHDDAVEAERIFEAELRWLRDRFGEGDIITELWYRHGDPAGPRIAA